MPDLLSNSPQLEENMAERFQMVENAVIYGDFTLHT